jgi:hypothetical protein
MGNHLRQGITATAYHMHSIYRAFKAIAEVSQASGQTKAPEFYMEVAQAWRTRAYLLAREISKQRVTDENLQTTHPFSLMEGVSGQICFLSDLLRNENELRFPGVEV